MARAGRRRPARAGRASRAVKTRAVKTRAVKAGVKRVPRADYPTYRELAESVKRGLDELKNYQRTAPPDERLTAEEYQTARKAWRDLLATPVSRVRRVVVWYAYDGGRWRPIPTERVRDYPLDRLRQSYRWRDWARGVFCGEATARRLVNRDRKDFVLAAWEYREGLTRSEARARWRELRRRGYSIYEIWREVRYPRKGRRPALFGRRLRWR